MRTIVSLALLGGLVAGCDPKPDADTDTDTPVDYPDLVPGAPLVGAAEGSLKLPAGTPLAGFTVRCGCLGGSVFREDARRTPHAFAFIPSVGHHIRPTIKAVWVENGDEHLVMTKTDVIYSNDKLTDALTQELERRTGLPLKGKVTTSGNHNHSSYGTFSAHEGLYLGSDLFDPHNFERMVQQMADVAEEAYNTRRAAAIGVGRSKDWDPSDRVYSDRRGDNDDLVVWPDAGPEQGKKDPYLHVIRMDDAVTTDPIAVIMAWGMHPYVFGESVQLATADATALVEAEVAESFEKPVVAMFLQAGGGDTSVRGSDDGWARMETVGWYARDAILDLWAQIPTSSDAIRLETASKAIPMNLTDVKVTRNGTVNWYYPPYEAERPADNIVYDENGVIKSPLDEFNTDFGVAFCGSGDFDLPVGGMPSDAPEYTSCMNISLLSRLVLGFFGRQRDTEFGVRGMVETDVTLPMDGMAEVYTAASRLGPVPVRNADGSTSSTDLLLGFFPGETTSMYVEQFRRRTLDELGYETSIAFGYSMDHEGYLLLPEDWLRGGYEPDISFWGPLGAEYIMESMLSYIDDTLGTDDKEPYDAEHGPHDYPEVAMWPEVPDTTPEAGTQITNATAPAYVWIPDTFTLDVDTPAQVSRVSGLVQVAWYGGDPSVDDPRITLERETSPGVFEPVKSRGGREINEDHHDFGVTWTPDPLFPSSATQTHTWWAVWQAVSHIHDRPGLPAGNYRFTVKGKRYGGENAAFPWDTLDYTFSTSAFEIVPATVTITQGDGGVWASLVAPADGFRMIDIDGSSTGNNPLRGDLTVTWETDAGVQAPVTVAAGDPQSGRTWLPFPAATVVYGATVTDAYGNTGTISWSPL